MKKLLSFFLTLTFMFVLVGCKDKVTHQGFFNEINILYEKGDKDNVDGNFEFIYEDNKDVKVVFKSLNEDVIKIDNNKAIVIQGNEDITVTIKVEITIKGKTINYEYTFNVLKIEVIIKPDLTPPVITGAKDFTYIIGEALPNYLDGVSATDDVDGEVLVSVDDSLVNLNEAGVYTIYFIAIDSSGNIAEIEKEITVIKPDLTPPVITGTKDFTYIIGEALPNYLDGVSATDDVDGEVLVSVDDSLVNLNEAGVYKIYFIATDSSGNIAEVEKEITVIKLDLTPPVIIGAKDFIYIIGEDAPNYLDGVSAIDDVHGEVLVSIDDSLVNLSEAGVYTIYFIAIDSSGNITEIEKEITVIKPDLTPPVIIGAKDFIYIIGEDAPNYLDGVSAIDDVDGDVLVEVQAPFVDLTKVGVYALFFIAIDSSGNKTVIETKIEVIKPLDETPPVIIGAKDFIYIIGESAPNYLDGVSAIDDVDGEVLVSIDDSLVNLSEPGVYPLYFIATDSSGNIAEREKEITVVSPSSTEEYITETFDSIPSTGSSYVDGEFVGENGLSWSYIKSRSDLTLDGKALTFRHEESAKLYTTLEKGLTSFSITAAQAYSGDAVRNIALYVNGVEVVVFGVKEGNAQTFSVDNLNFQGNILIEIKNIGANRVTIDNIVLGFNDKTVEEKLLETVYQSLSIPLTFISEGEITLHSIIEGVSVVWDYVDINNNNNKYINLLNGIVTIPENDIQVSVSIKATLTYEGYQKEKSFTLLIGEGEPISISDVRNTTNGSHIKTKGIITSSVLKNGVYYAFMEDSKNGVYIESNEELVVGTEVILKAVKQIIDGVITLTDISDVKIINTKDVNVSVIGLNQLGSFLGMYVEINGFLTKNTSNNQTEYELATEDGTVKIVLPKYINQTILQALLSGKEAGVKVSLEGYVYKENTIYLIDEEMLFVSDVVFNDEISSIIINNIDFPLNNQETASDLILPTKDTLFNSTIEWISSNPSVLSDTGKVGNVETNTTVTLYYVIKIGSKIVKEGSINIVVLKSEPLLKYYNAVEGLLGNELFLGLRSVITTGRTNTSYDQAKEILQNTDRDPNNSNNILLVYNRASIRKEWLSSLPWNREHVWPQSYLGSAPVGEIHNLKPCDVGVNSSRGNKSFARGSGSYGSVSGGWYPGDDDIGDVARIMFYMITAYSNLNINTMGSLEMFIEWHNADPVDDYERNRNDVIFGYTKNRNPYIDHPHFVDLIWGSQTTYVLENEQITTNAYFYVSESIYTERKSFYLEA